MINTKFADDFSNQVEKNKREEILAPLPGLSRHTKVKNKSLSRKRKDSSHPLRNLRIRVGYTLEDLAETTNLSPSYLSRLESGHRRLNEDVIKRLSHALECHPSELLPFNNQEFPSPPANQNNTYPIDLPVYILQSQDGVSGRIEADHPVQWMARINDLIGVQNAFACIFENDNWSPRYQKGERILIHTTAPLKSESSILLCTKDNKTYIGKLKGITEGQNGQEFSISLDYNKDKKENIVIQQDQITFAYRAVGTLENI